ncbi:MAG: branched-chain amino acid aminotransferase/4-amino-4-deoxychorismate lyase [Bacteroidetes bacterium]|jgi:branched-chain amino acid aminotransferase|nr:branched-chain amino acid aminotransferase/4-amino-4-deoxychorismate lyase [Bacteroidota bacterium]MDF2450799.1 branched-chain amino acid aminotransferase/4-amino-4-deoxychorismate lyase [Bacteroidota bacterium]
MDSYCIYNGHVISLYEPAISFTNRAFRYGDSVFESIRYTNGKIMFLADHIKRIKLSMTTLRMNVPAEFTSANIEQLIVHLLEQNSIKQDARIRLTVFRNEGGFYTPDTNDISFLIETEKLEDSGYALNQKGLWVDIYAEIKKPINKISNIKTGSALLYVMAGLTKTSLRLDDCLLVNDNGNIIESINSNIFVVKNGTLYTSPISDGCVDGVMRKQILDIAAQNKILAFEQPLTVHTLTNGDEVFLTNAIKGVQWVGQFKNKFYTNQRSVFFTEKLNESAK